MTKFVTVGLSLLTTFFVFAQSSNSKVDLAKERLATGKSISEILRDPQFDSIRSETSFRELIKSKANQQPVTVVMDKEPGTRITVKGVIRENAKPAGNMLVY